MKILFFISAAALILLVLIFVYWTLSVVYDMKRYEEKITAGALIKLGISIVFLLVVVAGSIAVYDYIGQECSSCGYESFVLSSSEQDFCPNCGAGDMLKERGKVSCSRCYKINKDENNYCVYCGNELGENKYE